MVFPFFIPVNSSWALCWHQIYGGCFPLPARGLCFSPSRFCTHLSSARCAEHKLRYTSDLLRGLSPSHRFWLVCSPSESIWDEEHSACERSPVLSRQCPDYLLASSRHGLNSHKYNHGKKQPETSRELFCGTVALHMLDPRAGRKVPS